MSSRQNWFWISLAVCLLAIIFLHERFSLKTQPGPTRVFTNLTAAGVTTLQVKLEGQPHLRVERTNTAWMITDPLVYPAQTISIENLLARLERLTSSTYITANELKSRPGSESEYGLTTPQATIVLQGALRTHIALGALTAPGDQLFLQ